MGTKDDNERGISFLCTSGDYDLLVTGDMDIAAEKRLISMYTLPDIEALVAGHHGARTSTSDELLSALKPERVIISVGANSYGHPTAEMLRRQLDIQRELVDGLDKIKRDAAGKTQAALLQEEAALRASIDRRLGEERTYQDKRIALMGERQTRNERDYQIAWQAAEAALMDAQFDIRGPNSDSAERVALFTPDDISNFIPGCTNFTTYVRIQDR